MHSIITLSLLATLASQALAVPPGQVITSCTTPNTIALTFDDGPSEYTNELLDLLSEYGARSTFFLLGDGSLAHPDAIQRMRREGHQVASHTYVPAFQEKLPLERELTPADMTIPASLLWATTRSCHR
jgi:peptidoglycan/xylan/chitin deacetylase (PgdA/CDA1 family)